MSVSNGVISAPVSIDDVNNVLGHGSTDLGTLCQSSKINMWAKYKPVSWDSVNVNLTNSNWFKGSNGLCGLNIPSENGTPDNIYNEEWTHAKPTRFFRLLDFEGYNHNSAPLFTTWMKSEYEASKDSPVVYISCIVYNPTYTNNLQVTDCELLSNFRLGLKITYDNKNYIITSNNKASEVFEESGILQCAIDFSSIYNRNSNRFNITAFLTTENYPTIDTFPTIITCYALPNYLSGYSNKSTVTYTAITAGISFTAYGMANNINGTYYDEEYYARNPYNWASHYYEYWKIKVVNTHTDKNVSFNVEQFTWYGKNVNGDDVTNTYSDELRMYDSNKNQTYNFVSQANSTMYIYVRTRILGYGATLGSSYISTETFDNTIRGIWTNTAEGISNWSAGRFELTLYKSTSYNGGK